jgi:hypothetical protein
MSHALSTGEQLDLTALETIVDEGLTIFIEVGRALAEIRDRRLYRASHSTFEEYVHERWLLSRTRAYQLIDAAVVVTEMSTMVDTPPSNERQARELLPLKDEDEAIVEVWRGLRGQYGDRVTAHRVKFEVERYLERKPKTECPGCGRHVLLDRIDNFRGPIRPGWCERCGNKLPHDNTISEPFVIDSERKRQLAEAAVGRFWNIVSARGDLQGLGPPIHEAMHLNRALALLTDEEITEAITGLEKGIAETKTFVAELRRHRSGR